MHAAPVPAPRVGRTPDGTTFPVPPTPDMFHSLAGFSRCGPSELLTHLFVLLSMVSVVLVRHLPLWIYILNFAFWRLGYNLGLAVLLHRQSKRNSITCWLRSLTPPARSLVHWASTRPIPPPYRWEAAPDAFNAWLAFRSLSTVILANDGMSYVALAGATFRPLAESQISTLLLAFPTGIALLALSFWSKAAAHNALGDFAWFWGDFFFKMDGDLVLNGVFELFPHPMYTVGYAGYYGAALICRSYTLLLVSLLAHVGQLVFLAMVEEPHIRKIYGPPAPTDKQASDAEPLAASTPVDEKPPSTYAQFISGAPQTPVVAAIVAMLATHVWLCAITPPVAPLAAAVTLCWRAIHWMGCAVLLAKGADGGPNAWMQWFGRRGSTDAQAFSNWQLVFLFSSLLNHALFVVTAVSCSGGVKAGITHSLARDWSLFVGGCSLIAIAIVSVASAWSVTGAFGFYYGDFFVAPESRELPHTGAFRYVTHPELSLGFLAYYGVAIVRQSTGLFAIAALCQGMHMLFVAHVEEPHVRREYKLIHRSTALETSVKNLPIVGVLLVALSRYSMRFTEKVHEKGGAQLGTVSKTATVKFDRLRADFKKTKSRLWDQHVVKCAKDLKIKAQNQTGIEDCEKVISMLEGRGLVVARVGNSEVM